MGIKRSPTETLMKALEEFGTDEPMECIVVFSTQGGDIVTMASTDTISTKIGLLETAKQFQFENLKKWEEGEK